MMDEDAKKAFLKLPLNEQLLAILDCMTFIRNEVNNIKERQQNFEEDTRRYRKMRERIEELEKSNNAKQ